MYQTYYSNPVLLDREKHRRRRIRATPGFAFARGSNSIYLAGAEFSEACKEYPIVFARRADGKFAPIVVLGLRDRENLYVDEQNRWNASYVPAFVRRYPFVLAELPGRQMAVCIDEAFPGLNDTEGEPLFDDKGAHTPFLQGALDFLQRYQLEYLRTEAFCGKLADAGLLTEMSARADLVDGRTFTLTGLMVVDDKKMQALPDDKVLDFFRTGELHLISMHLLSLSNLSKLVDKMKQQPGAQAGNTSARAGDAVAKPG